MESGAPSRLNKNMNFKQKHIKRPKFAWHIFFGGEWGGGMNGYG